MSDGRKKAPALEPGQWVEIDGMPGVARLLEIDLRRRRARVQMRTQEWILPLRRLRPTPPPKLPAPRPNTLVRYVGNSVVRHEIDLHGMRVEDALNEVDYALDQAVVHQLSQLKIIHGYGTGRVRTAVRQMLATHPHVSTFRFGSPFEGGLACTIAEIRAARP